MAHEAKGSRGAKAVCSPIRKAAAVFVGCPRHQPGSGNGAWCTNSLTRADTYLMRDSQRDRDAARSG